MDLFYNSGILDGQYCIGQDCGIYWQETDPPEKGAEAPEMDIEPDVEDIG